MEEAFEKYKQIRDFHDIIGITLLTCVCPEMKPLSLFQKRKPKLMPINARELMK